MTTSSNCPRATWPLLPYFPTSLLPYFPISLLPHIPTSPYPHIPIFLFLFSLTFSCIFYL
ncbi:hypothetical protein E7Z59_07770 [Robertkochia marina]|uniref:Uncharacterized protein n=1 Tax=Robertkochia marina TaxID=1227945 RepID=A0A4S3M167_9FLAO|nr:hypothetical protein E7Z59_07770 [Robertkochia marina]TRZ44696.1 hypothetical protein D3A96_08175 [Robertkochia marina]